MSQMHNIFHHFIEFKLAIAGILFFLVTSVDAEISIKIFGAMLYVGYLARRWYLMEKNKNKTNDTNSQ